MRVLLAEHHRQVLRALQTLLNEKTEYILIGDAADADSLLAQAEAKKPDLVLLDWELPGQPRVDLVADLYALDSRLKVIVISSKLEVQELAIKAGAHAFVSKGDPPQALLDALREMQLTLDVRNPKEADELDEHDPQPPLFEAS
jgi:DNA-binding NarL/FixJ family response regulator